MRITHTGDVLVNGLLVHSSSQRWKTNIQPIEGALDKVQRLRGVSYNRKADGRHDTGVIAEEVGQVIPEVVTYEENGIDAQGVDYAR
ncbi:tail fiber domain-containing protein, partial [Candidatus Poribacteria bacterium]|nr:tail fiber domain-containing protein [Candidatus Poribacteria bacterium]